MTVSPEVRQRILECAGLHCEREGKDCDHHRPGTSCTKGLRGRDWVAHRRFEGAGDALWNVVGWCLPCYQNNTGG